MKVLSIDIETFSSVNLQKCGVYKYAESEDFEILLFGYAVDGGAVQVVEERLKVTIRTPESAEEYAKMNKAQRDQAKDHGGFVGGVLKGGRRKIDTVESRSMLSLDGDRITKEFLEEFEATFPYTSVLYTTHSSTEENPRARIVCPLTRDVTPEEFVAVSRYVAQMPSLRQSKPPIRRASRSKGLQK